MSPAGIVQSTQPQPNLSVFVNSKESSILQSLRDEAEKEKLNRNRLVQTGLRVLQEETVNPALESVVVDAALRESRSSADRNEDVAKVHAAAAADKASSRDAKDNVGSTPAGGSVN